jgi:Protein of unknown function (DUF2815)
MSTKVVLRNVRIAFIQNLWTPGQYEGKGAFTHSCKFFMDKDSDAKKAVDAAILEEAKGLWKDKAAMKLKEFEFNALKFPFLDGDRKANWNGAAGNWVLTAKRSQASGAPKIVHRNKEVSIREEDGILYAGCEVNAVVEVWAQKAPNDGVRCSLVSVQYVKDGESFGGAAPATAADLDDLSFDDSDDDLM